MTELRKLLVIKLLKSIYGVLDLVGSRVAPISFILKHKIKIGILLVGIQGTKTSAQVQVSRGTCYMWYNPNWLYGQEAILSHRVTTNSIENHATDLKFGEIKGWYNYGLSLSYYYDSQSVGIGPYFRFIPFDFRYLKYFIEANYQLNTTGFEKNELNLASGFYNNFMRNIGLEVSYTYSYSGMLEHKNLFMPSIGIHYYFKKSKYSVKRLINRGEDSSRK